MAKYTNNIKTRLEKIILFVGQWNHRSYCQKAAMKNPLNRKVLSRAQDSDGIPKIVK